MFVEDQYGVVEDIRLNYTFLRTLGDQQVVIPNEKLATGILRNDTLGDGAVGLDVVDLAPPDERRRARGRGAGGGDRPDRLGGGGHRHGRAAGGRRRPVPSARRAPREAALRLQCLTRLRAEGLLPAE